MIDRENQQPEQKSKLLAKEIDKTKEALKEAIDHEFRFGYAIIFENDQATFNWIEDEQLSFSFDTPQPEDEVWFGNCYEDAAVTSKFLKERVGEGATVTIQKIESDDLNEQIGDIEHYRVLVEQAGGDKSVFIEVDHSQLYSEIVGGENNKIHSWADAIEYFDTERKTENLKTKMLFPMYEYDQDGQRVILFFAIIDDYESKEIQIKMQPLSNKKKINKNLDSITYPVYFHQLTDKSDVLEDIKTNEAFDEDGPFSDFGEETLFKMRQGLGAVVRNLPEKIK